MMDTAVAMLIAAAVKSTVTEILFWSKDRTLEEIQDRAAKEEQRTDDLMARMNANPDGGE